MQTTRKAVRYYIDRDADTPIIRSVPVTRPSSTGETAKSRINPESAAEHAANEHRRRAARHRLASLVQASVRKRRQHES